MSDAVRKPGAKHDGSKTVPPMQELSHKLAEDLGLENSDRGPMASLFIIRDADLRSGILSGDGVQDGDVIPPSSDTVQEVISELERLVSILRLWRVWNPDGKAALPCSHLWDIGGVEIGNSSCLVGFGDEQTEGIYISIRIDAGEGGVHRTVHDEENDRDKPEGVAR